MEIINLERKKEYTNFLINVLFILALFFYIKVLQAHQHLSFCF